MLWKNQYVLFFYLKEIYVHMLSNLVCARRFWTSSETIKSQQF